MSDTPLVLGIETSCDETAVGLVSGDRLLVDSIASSKESQKTESSPSVDASH